MTNEEAIKLLDILKVFDAPDLSEAIRMAKDALREQPRWIPVEERRPDDWVSVLGYMTDAGEFPPVRECYAVDGSFWFPALREFHPVSHWMPMPTKEEV